MPPYFPELLRFDLSMKETLHIQVEKGKATALLDIGNKCLAKSVIKFKCRFLSDAVMYYSKNVVLM